MSTPQIALGNSETWTPLSPSSNLLNSDSFVQSILRGAKGGESTRAYFDQYNVIGQLYKQIVDRGDEAWTEDEDEDGKPLFSVSLLGPNGDSYYLVLRTDGIATDTNGNVQPNGNTIVINGTTYDCIGTANYEIGYNNFTFAKTSRQLAGIAGSFVPLTLLKPYIVSAFRAITAAVGKGVRALMALARGGAAAEDAALEAAVNGEVELQEIGIATEGPAAVEAAAAAGGLATGTILIGVAVVLAVAFLAVSFVLHNSTHALRIWNLTKYNMEWNYWFDTEVGSAEGQFTKVPGFKDDSGAFQRATIFGASKRKKTPFSKAEPAVVYGDFEIESSHEYNGIGYALQLFLKDQGDSNALRYTATVYYDIPFTGDNSHNVTFVNVPDLKSWYKNNQGNNKSTTAQATSSDGQILAVSSYDYLSGQHVTPGQQEGSTNESYYYQSILAITEPSLTIDEVPLVNPPNTE
ncbi:hypothetical protein F5Y10DRAFT_256498 [Nemania abortiva]|nr:hypothetical protein F5Y10DRAFT_256498 [Nemania abortiva]